MKNRTGRITFEQAEQARARHRTGESIYVLARAFGIAPQTVARIIALEIHRPPGRRVIPVLVTPRDFAALTLRAEETGTPVRELAASILARALSSSPT